MSLLTLLRAGSALLLLLGFLMALLPQVPTVFPPHRERWRGGNFTCKRPSNSVVPTDILD